jgi:hypothetical protein
MIYEFILVVFGIYMGQEYNNIPSINYLMNNSLKYMKEKNTENEIDKNIFTYLYNVFKR